MHSLLFLPNDQIEQQSLMHANPDIDPDLNIVTGQQIPHAQAVHWYLFPKKIHFSFR